MCYAKGKIFTFSSDKYTYEKMLITLRACCIFGAKWELPNALRRTEKMLHLKRSGNCTNVISTLIVQFYKRDWYSDFKTITILVSNIIFKSRNNFFSCSLFNEMSIKYILIEKLLKNTEKLVFKLQNNFEYLSSFTISILK